jgi:hypothetical protein
MKDKSTQSPLEVRPSLGSILVLRTADAYSSNKYTYKNTEKKHSIGSAGDLINTGTLTDMKRHRMGIFYGRQ